MSWVVAAIAVAVFAVAGYFWVELRDREKRLSQSGYKNPNQNRNRIVVVSVAAALLPLWWYFNSHERLFQPGNATANAPDLIGRHDKPHRAGPLWWGRSRSKKGSASF